MDFTFFAPWHDVLPREPGHVVAFAGGRGKEALIDAVAAVYAAEGVPVERLAPGGADPGDAAVVLADADGPADAALRTDPAAAAWPARTSLAVLVAGIDAIGRRADAALPADDLPPELEPWTVLEWDHAVGLTREAAAVVPPDVPLVLALWGLEEQPDSIGLFDFTGRMMADPRLAVVLFCGRGEDGPAIRACARADGG